MGMAYTAPTPAEIRSITDVDLAFSSTKYLPDWEDIPSEFRGTNRYTRLVSALFAGDDLPPYEMALKDGYTPELVRRLVASHLRSFAPKHEHKIAGIAYMLSCICELKDEDAP